MHRDADTEEEAFNHNRNEDINKRKEAIHNREENLEETAANRNENRKAVVDKQNKNQDAADWRALVRRAQQGDASAMEEMVEANIGLIHMVLKRMGIRENYDREELFQVGAMGLVSAIKRFDLSTEYSFSTYAVPMILGEIRRFLRDDGMIHVGRRIKENAAQIARCKEQILREQNHEPTIREIAKATGLSQEDIILALGSSVGVESIQRPLGSGDDSQAQTLEEQLADEEHTDEQLINRVTVQHLLASLTEDERKLIYLRYMEGRTQTETAGLLGMTQVNVSRLEKKILGKLRMRM